MADLWLLALYSCELGRLVLFNSVDEDTGLPGELLNLSGGFNFSVTAEHLITRVSTALVQIMFVSYTYIYVFCISPWLSHSTAL